MGTLQGLLNRCKVEVGYIEKASNANLDSETANKGLNNYTKYSRDLIALGIKGYQGAAWCATYQFWQEVQEFGLETALKHWNMTKSDYVGYNCFSTYNMFKKAGKTSKIPRLGCLVIFTFSHMARVVKISADGKTIYTNEGNTSAKTYDRNGGMVAEKSYSIHDPKIKGFCIIDYDENVATQPAKKEPAASANPVSVNVKEGQKWLNTYYKDLFLKHLGALLEVDGSYGNKTRAAAVCAWKDIVNRKYGFKLDPGNPNFLYGSKEAAARATIRKGSSGTLPLILQLVLSAKGFYTGKMDADFGNGTKSAVEAFQRSRNLAVDGVVGANTWFALFN